MGVVNDNCNTRIGKGGWPGFPRLSAINPVKSEVSPTRNSKLGTQNCFSPHSGACGRVLPSATLIVMRQKMALPFALFLILALFPYGWLAHLWPPFGLFIYWLFETELAHYIGHSLIFATLGWFLLTLFPTLRSRFALYLMLIGGLGLGQELLQLWYKQRPLGVNDGKDLLIDIAAATLLFLVYQWGSKQSQSTLHTQPE